MSPGVMDGVRVLEVGIYAFGPAAGAVLADWGADVIKVEHPDEPDQSRGSGTDKALNRCDMGTAFLTQASKLWSAEPSQHLYTQTADGTKSGLKGAEISGELAPELLGVGYLIGPRIASMMMAGAVLSYFVIGPMIANFGEKLNEPVAPATSQVSFLVCRSSLRRVSWA